MPSSTSMRGFLATLSASLLAVTLVTAARAADPPAASAEPGADTVAAARQIAEEGLSLYDKGSYAEAITRFEKAGALVQAPTMGLMAARSLEKLGRWVEAAERYRAVTEMRLPPDASAPFKEAQTSAATERAALLLRLPHLTITINAAPEGATVTLDGKPFSPGLGSTTAVDPGPHTVIIAGAGARKTERVTLKPAEDRRLALTLEAPAPPSTGSGLRTAGWISLAVGGAGLIAGAVTGGLLLSTKATLDQAPGCPDRCPSEYTADVARYKALYYIPVPSLIAGGAAAAAGALAIGLSPSPTAPRQGAVKLLLGPGTAGVRVTF